MLKTATDPLDIEQVRQSILMIVDRAAEDEEVAYLAIGEGWQGSDEVMKFLQQFADEVDLQLVYHGDLGDTELAFLPSDEPEAMDEPEYPDTTTKELAPPAKPVASEPEERPVSRSSAPMQGKSYQVDYKSNMQDTTFYGCGLRDWLTTLDQAFEQYLGDWGVLPHLISMPELVPDGLAKALFGDHKGSPRLELNDYPTLQYALKGKGLKKLEFYQPRNHFWIPAPALSAASQVTELATV